MSWQPNDDPRFAPTVHELANWAKEPLVLQRPQGTQLHDLLDNWKAGQLIRPRVMAGDEVQNFDSHVARLLSPQFQIFLIEHNWADAFKYADDFASDPERPLTDQFDFRLPYPDCCFEIILSEKRVCLLVHYDGENYRLAAFVRFKMGWLQPPLAWREFRSLPLRSMPSSEQLASLLRPRLL